MADEPALSKGMSSEWVQYLQRLLASAGHWGGADDGEFGDDLEQAVAGFQSSRGLTADGAMGPATWAALTGESPPSGGGGGGGGSGGASQEGITIPSELAAALNIENFPELAALIYSSDFDDYLRRYVGIDPQVFADEPELLV